MKNKKNKMSKKDEFAKIDANNDGVITKEEWNNYHNKTGNLRGKKPVGGKVKASVKKTTKEATKHKRNRRETFSVYIYKVLKQVHNDTGISKKSMAIMNSFINDTFEKIAIEASKLVRYNKKHTLSAREVQSAVKLLLPGELANAIIEGAKAVNKIASGN